MAFPPTDNPWTPEEDQVLREQYRSYRWEEMERLLPGRTRIAMRGRAVKLGIQAPKEPYWSEEHVAFLKEHFDRRRITWIASQLGRTETSVKLKAKRLGLRHRHRKAITPSQIGKMLRICSKQVKDWIERRWLPAHFATCRKKIHLVEVPDLVSFLRTHPEKWDARRCPDLHIKLGLTRKQGEAALGDRPLWFREKLAADNRKGRRGKRWTREEDEHLARLMKRGLSYPEIGAVLGRAANAIDHRVHRLGRRIWDLVRQKGA